MSNEDELNRQVTAAIFAAERYAAKGSAEACAAYTLVSALEEKLASRTDPQSLEGEIARLGAVLAAYKAENPKRASDLIQKFLQEDLSYIIRYTLIELDR